MRYVRKTRLIDLYFTSHAEGKNISYKKDIPSMWGGEHDVHPAVLSHGRDLAPSGYCRSAPSPQSIHGIPGSVGHRIGSSDKSEIVSAIKNRKITCPDIRLNRRSSRG